MQKDQEPNLRESLVLMSARQRLGAACLGVAIVVGFLSLGLAQRLGFDFGTWFGPCGFKQRYGLPCPTCGMTTSVLAFARGDPARSFSTQPCAGLMCSALAGGAVLLLWVAACGRCPGPVARFWARLGLLHVLLVLALIVAAGWIWTLVRAIRV
ncbi:MAG: DUF2752 domain-containing protein [Phycisphaerae bacterium]|nr:DUF2752 domain-containing protein [Phycisphaerae bacterium]